MIGKNSILRFTTQIFWRSLFGNLLNFIRRNSNNVRNLNNPLELKLLTRLKIGFSHIKEHKFKHNFQDSVDPLRSCGNDLESTVNFFLYCPNFTTQRSALLNKLKSINTSIMAEIYKTWRRTFSWNCCMYKKEKVARYSQNLRPF